MRISVVPLVLSLATAFASAQDLAAFRAQIDGQLKKHPFFTKIAFTVVDKHPPFLFYLQRPPSDVPDYDRAIVNSYLPFLTELTRQCEQQYWQPAGLSRSAEAPGFAIAILDSAGSYLNFRTAIGEPSLAQARAHYTPDLRLAVTYVDTFAARNTNAEERHALLHEFVHALQHAYGANGQMTKPVWYNEGLADYRSASTNIASSLALPPLQHRHVQALGFAYGNPAGRFYVAPLVDLVAANSYQDVLDLAAKRNKAELRVDVLMPVFYSQSEMFVRFLHEANGGQFRPGFLAYVKAVQSGKTGLEMFQQAFDCAGPGQLSALENAWLQWLDDLLRATYPTMRSLTKAATGAVQLAGPLSPPAPIDKKGLAFTAADFVERIAGARRRCGTGDYDGALAMLPGDSDELAAAQKDLAKRERTRMAALVELRDEVLADHEKKKSVMTIPIGDETVRGRLVRRDAAGIVLLVGKDERVVPLEAMTPALLVREGNRLKKFEGAARWLQIWLRWLQGEKLSVLKRFLDLDYGSMAELRQDVTGDFQPEAGVGAAALEMLRGLMPTDDAKEARRELTRLQAAVLMGGRSPLLQQRKAVIDTMARAYAERAFNPLDLVALGVSGKVSPLANDQVLVDYAGADAPDDLDFTLIADLTGSPMAMPKNAIAYDGPTGFVRTAGGHHLIGSGQVRWAVPLSGPQVIEYEFTVLNAGHWAVMLCTEQGGCLYVTPMGEVLVLDSATNIEDSVGGNSDLFLEKAYTMRIEHDGEKKLVVKRDGKVVTTVSNVGSRIRGELRFYVHASTPLLVRNLRISGRPDPLDLQPLRDAFVAKVLGRLWQ